ncbi:MAG: DUF1963 domain-containing protein [Planctomycetes bacterium]|nr:DUF1963 domain-containing protein [Planctomycetota bacterium]
MSDTLDELADRFGFASQAPILRKYLLPSIGFALGPDSARGLDSSRLGGAAALPRAFEWPTNLGRPLEFLLQLNLSELSEFRLPFSLPPEGMLTFFYDLKEYPWGYDPKDLDGFRVYFFPDVRELRQQMTPASEYALAGASMTFWAADSLPTPGSRAGARLLAELETSLGSEPDLDDLQELSSELFGVHAPVEQRSCHQIGGHSNNIQGDMQLEAQLVMHGLYCGDPSGYDDLRAKKLESSCEEWMLLLQLDSDDEAGFMWGDAGMLYCWARASDIEKRDFSKTWMALECF